MSRRTQSSTPQNTHFEQVGELLGASKDKLLALIESHK